MISVEEAKQIVSREIAPGAKTNLALLEALGRVLAEDIVSPIDSPSFDASAMDGFALNHEAGGGFFKIVRTIAAGDVPQRPIGPRETMKIMTGAMLPSGATAVIPQEEVLLEKEKAIHVSTEAKKGQHIRYKGEELREGEIVLTKGTALTAGTIGFLASLGIFQIPVYSPPKIFIIPTGSELIRDPQERNEGKIFESNSFCLQAALAELRLPATVSHPIPDIPKILSAALETALHGHDFVLITGGVSVGQFDFVKAILARQKVETLFWQVAQKPGKPLYFGRKGTQFVFGLPGNPASALVCFYQYVRPALLKRLGYTKIFPNEVKAKLAQNFAKKDHRTHFVRALAAQENGSLWVQPLPGQESHKMISFAKANALLVVPQEVEKWERGEEVTLQWL